MEPPSQFRLVDLSGWAQGDDEPLGETGKQWFRDPSDGTRWLYKPNRPNRSPDEGACEAATSRIATLFGIPSATVELARYADTAGCISRNVVSSPENQMEEAAIFLGEFTDNFDPKDKSSRGHSQSTIRALLNQIGAPLGRDERLTATDWFAGYLLFDALIGNTDRHSQNWAIEITPVGDMHLAPSFDHATSLAVSNRGDQRQSLLAHPERIPAFAARATAHRFESGGKQSLVDFACTFLHGCPAAAVEHWRQAVTDFPLSTGIAVIQGSTMSAPASTLAIKVMESNVERLRRCLNC